jgi:hypothetical protein
LRNRLDSLGYGREPVLEGLHAIWKELQASVAQSDCIWSPDGQRQFLIMDCGLVGGMATCSGIPAGGGLHLASR